MNIEIILAGVWLFACSTTLAKNVAGWFMLITYLIALIVSFLVLN